MGEPPIGPPGAGRGLALKGFFGGADEHADVAWIAVAAVPRISDRALAQTLAGALGRAVAAARRGRRGRAQTATAAARCCIDGYAQAMEVIAREWRVGEGPPGRCRPTPARARSATLFAAVRENRSSLGADGAPRPARRAAGRPGRGGDGPLPPGAVEGGRAARSRPPRSTRRS